MLLCTSHTSLYSLHISHFPPHQLATLTVYKLIISLVAWSDKIIRWQASVNQPGVACNTHKDLSWCYFVLLLYRRLDPPAVDSRHGATNTISHRTKRQLAFPVALVPLATVTADDILGWGWWHLLLSWGTSGLHTTWYCLLAALVTRLLLVESPGNIRRLRVAQSGCGRKEVMLSWMTVLSLTFLIHERSVVNSFSDHGFLRYYLSYLPLSSNGAISVLHVCTTNR